MYLLIEEFNSYILTKFLILLIIYLLIFLYLAPRLKLNKYEILFIVIFHLFFLFFYSYIFNNQNNDAIQSYFYCYEDHRPFYNLKLSYKSTDNLIWFVKNLCNILGQNYLLIATNFNLIGSFGIIILYSCLKKINKNKNIFNYSLLIIIFFPSIFFWTSTISKDTICFTGLCLMIYYLNNNNLKNIFVLISSLILIFFSKPHIFILTSSILLFLLFLKYNISIYAKILIIFIASLPIYYLLLLLLNYSGYNYTSVSTIYEMKLSITSIKEYFSNFSNRFRYSDGYIDETFIIRLFNLFLIPKLSEIYSMTSLFTGIETVILLFIFLYFLILLPNRNYISINILTIQFSYLFILVMLIFYSITIYNTGVFLRQKIFILPFILYLFLDRLYFQKNFDNEKKSN